jgi:hypothetical protein
VSALGADSQALKVAEVSQTEADSGVDLDAEVGPTAAGYTGLTGNGLGQRMHP